MQMLSHHDIGGPPNAFVSYVQQICKSCFFLEAICGPSFLMPDFLGAMGTLPPAICAGEVNTAVDVVVTAERRDPDPAATPSPNTPDLAPAHHPPPAWHWVWACCCCVGPWS